ncbi:MULTISPECIES: hypothetical protein [unclassified Sphingobium]|uniref:hypothetical protein n=1 Tax=unclassified Sphingobium TaxID=2611147 RepID=UPI0022256B8B|nr:MULTISPECIES: hypothetical protein [unclassified Sphingobium]MCW2412030.1 hypothetical protein [Sphingobium sp. B8D3D]MCW2415672.1 hypothetical protein [Sphingobium sp. B8D3A]
MSFNQDGKFAHVVDMPTFEAELGRLPPRSARAVLIRLLTQSLNIIGPSQVTSLGRIAFYRLALFFRIASIGNKPFRSLRPHNQFAQKINTPHPQNYISPSMYNHAGEALERFCGLIAALGEHNDDFIQFSGDIIEAYRQYYLAMNSPDPRVLPQFIAQEPNIILRIEADSHQDAMGAARMTLQAFAKAEAEQKLGADPGEHLPFCFLQKDDSKDSFGDEDPYRRKDPYRRLQELARRGSPASFGLRHESELKIIYQLKQPEFWERDPDVVIAEIVELLANAEISDANSGSEPRHDEAAQHGEQLAGKYLEFLQSAARLHDCYQAFPASRTGIGGNGPPAMTCFSDEAPAQLQNAITIVVEHRPDRSSAASAEALKEAQAIFEAVGADVTHIVATLPDSENGQSLGAEMNEAFELGKTVQRLIDWFIHLLNVLRHSK